MRNCNYKILTLLGLCFLQMHLLAQNAGPAYVKNLLNSEGAFDTPTYQLTSDYDEFRSYDNIKGLFIDALDFGTNSSKVFCWYGVPESLEEGEKAPALVLVHGGGGTAFPEWVHRWTERGYIAIAIAHEGQLPGPKDPWYPTWEYSGPRRAGFYRDADKDISEQWFYHAIADAILANSLLRSFPEVDTTNIGINGISWGGILTNVITGIDQRFKFSIPVYGCGYLFDSPKYSVDMAANTKAELDFYYANWEPSLYIPLQNLPVFYVNGSIDKQFAMNIATRTYNTIPSEKYLCVKNPLQHSTASGYSTQEVYEFADYITNNTTAPVKVSIDEVDSTSFAASYQGSIDHAVIIYTTDSMDWDYTSLVWDELPLAINAAKSQITADIPKGTQYFYINVFTSEGFIYSSPMEKALFQAEIPIVEPSAPSTDVFIKASSSTNYGIDQVATLISEVQLAPDSIATYQLSCDITPSPGQGIMSGSGGGTSVASDWGVATTDDLSDIQNVIFNGINNEWVEISNIQIVNFNANGGDLSVDDLGDLSFQSLVIVNGQSNNKDAVAFTVNGNTISIPSSNITETHDTIDLEVVTETDHIKSFSIGAGDSPSQDKNKWSIESIIVKFSLDQTTSVKRVRIVKTKRLVIVPNPAFSSISINVNSASTYIYNMAGKCVKSDLANIETIDISSLNKGVFLVKVLSSEGDLLHGKFLKAM